MKQQLRPSFPRRKVFSRSVFFEICQFYFNHWYSLSSHDKKEWYLFLRNAHRSVRTKTLIPVLLSWVQSDVSREKIMFVGASLRESGLTEAFRFWLKESPEDFSIARETVRETIHFIRNLSLSRKQEYRNMLSFSLTILFGVSYACLSELEKDEAIDDLFIKNTSFLYSMSNKVSLEDKFHFVSILGEADMLSGGVFQELLKQFLHRYGQSMVFDTFQRFKQSQSNDQLLSLLGRNFHYFFSSRFGMRETALMTIRSCFYRSPELTALFTQKLLHTLSDFSHYQDWMRIFISLVLTCMFIKQKSFLMSLLPLLEDFQKLELVNPNALQGIYDSLQHFCQNSQMKNYASLDEQIQKILNLEWLSPGQGENTIGSSLAQECQSGKTLDVLYHLYPWQKSS